MTALRWRLPSPAVFAMAVASVYVVAFYVRANLASVASPDVMAAALAVDLVVLVPALYYFLVVRRRSVPALSVLGVFVLSLVAASFVIPDQYHRSLGPLKVLAGVAEILVLGFITWKAVSAVRGYRRYAASHPDADALGAIRSASHSLVKNERVASMLVSELAVFYYGLGSWRAKASDAPGRFTSYKRNAYGATLFGIMVVLAAELVAVHFLVQHYWSVTAAWVLTALSAYGIVWLLGDWQAYRLRPTVVDAGGLHLRAGLRWEVSIPFADIADLRHVSALEEKPKDVLNLVAIGDAHYELTAREPVVVNGAYGMRKTTRRIWFTIDDPAAFEAALGDIIVRDRKSP